MALVTATNHEPDLPFAGCRCTSTNSAIPLSHGVPTSVLRTDGRAAIARMGSRRADPWVGLAGFAGRRVKPLKPT